MLKKVVLAECDRSHVAFIFNPVSGTDDVTTRREELEFLVRSAGLSCDLTETDKTLGAAPAAAKAVRDGVQRIFVAGGDGSLAEAAEQIVGTDVEMAVIPSGTGNILAFNLGISSDPEDAMKTALEMPAHPMDIGRVNGRVFLVAAGMGFDGRVIHDTKRETKQRLGIIAYVLSAFRNLGKCSAPYRITVDGRRIRCRAECVMVANVGRIPGGMEIVPGADAEDGMLDITILRARTPLQYLRVMGRMMGFDRFNNDLMLIYRGRHITIQTTTPQPLQIDGNEAGATTRMDIEIIPGALKIVRPERQHEERTRHEQRPIFAPAAYFWIPVLAGIGALATLGLRRRSRN